MQFHDNFLEKWGQIIDQVEKDHVPSECIKKIIFKLEGKRQRTINFRTLKNQNFNIEEINSVVERFIQDNDAKILNMEFVLDIEAVANLLQPETDHLLKNL